MNHRPHLDDDAIVQHLDGVAAPGGAEHLAACPTCAARADTFARAAEAMRASAPARVDGDTRRRMISAAIEAATEGDAQQVVQPLRRWWRQPRAVGILAAAAVAVVVVGSLALVERGTNDDQLAQAPPSGSFGDEATLGGAPFYGDLGDLDDPAVLRSFVEESPGAAGGGSGGASADAESSSANEFSETAAAEDAAGDGDSTLSAPQSLEAPSVARTVDDEFREAAERCLARVGKPDESHVVFAAAGRFGGIPAVALAFRTSDARHLVVIVASDDCTILSAQSYG